MVLRIEAARKEDRAGARLIVLSLFDASGQWSHPWRDAGHEVVTMDLLNGVDVMGGRALRTVRALAKRGVHGVLMAPPCTEFCRSGARWWPEKDASGVTAASVALVRRGLEFVRLCNPRWWALENPVGRLSELVPELGKPFYFNPCDYGDPYTKKTGIWGRFVPPLPLFCGGDCSVAPELGSRMHRAYGGGRESARFLRSVTPMGFSYAFWLANRETLPITATAIAARNRSGAAKAPAVKAARKEATSARCRSACSTGASLFPTA